jgi:hypothetical protein
MARRHNRVTVADLVGDLSASGDHSIASWKQREEQRFQAEAESSVAKAEKAKRDADPDGPKALAGKGQQIDEAWARDEIDVVRKLARGSAGYGVVGDYGGELGRSLERRALGTGSAPSSSRAYEPSTGSGHSDAAARVWASLTDAQRALLDGMFGPGGAKSVAGKVREHMREGAVLGARQALEEYVASLRNRLLSLPQQFVLRLDPTEIDLHKATPMELLARAMGRLVGSDEAEKARITAEVGKELLNARHSFRDRLRQVDLNAATAGKAHLADLGREKRPFLVPPASLAEKERIVDFGACAGFLAVDGVRQTCGVLPTRADPSSWPRCDVCGNPRRM